MTLAPEIPDDVMAAAREVVVAYIEEAVGPMSAPFRGQVDRGEFDDWPLYAASARAILAERQRCVDAVKSKLIVADGENYVGVDGCDVDYDRGLYSAIRAITGAST